MPDARARLLTLAVALTAAVSPVGAQTLIDLTHPFDERTVYWPTARPFTLTVVHRGLTPGGFWYESNEIAASEHGGTHLDAPVHFARGRWTTDEIPLDVLTGPAVVVDIAARSDADADARLTVREVLAFEREHGRIAAGSIVLLRTGWGRRWPDRGRYLGSDRRSDASGLHFPGFGPGAARFLVDRRRVKMVGIDTASIDHGPSTDFPCHRIFGEANVPALENVAHMDRLPPVGATVIALPMKIGRGSGGPCRIVARLPEGTQEGERAPSP